MSNEFILRSRDQPLSVSLNSNTVMSEDIRNRVAELRLTEDLTRSRRRTFPLSQPHPALKCLHVGLQALLEYYDIVESFLPDPGPNLVFSNLSDLHINITPFPLSSSIYDNLVHLTLTNLEEHVWFSLNELQNLFSRVHRIETIVMDGVDLLYDLRYGWFHPGRVQLPTTLHSIRMSYNCAMNLPQLIKPRKGVHVGLRLTGEAPLIDLRTLRARQLAEEAPPSTLRVYTSADHEGDAPKPRARDSVRWLVTLSFWQDTVDPSEAITALQLPEFEIQHTLQSSFDLLDGASSLHITILEFVICLPEDTLAPRWSGLVERLPSLHTLHSTPLSLGFLLCTIPPPCTLFDDHDLSSQPLGRLREVHLSPDVGMKLELALKHLAVLEDWLRKRREAGFADINIHVVGSLRALLDSTSVCTY